MSKLIDIEGIGAAFAQKLEAAGVTSQESLLEVAGSKKGRVDLAAKSGISEASLLEWVNRADLARIKGIGSEFADLLEAAGVDSVTELAQRNAENLVAKMAEINQQKNIVRRTPTLAEVSAWVSEASTLPRLVTH